VPPGIPRPPPNIIITGTGPFASAGVTSVIWISTEIAGWDALSTRPTSCVPTTGRSPTIPLAVSVTTHVTVGTFAGTRPSTSRSKSSTISGRRRVRHMSAEVTVVPFFSVRISGRSGKGLASASS
jgi:hypothetical protein